MFNFSDSSVQRKWVLVFAPLVSMLLGWVLTKAPFLSALNLTGEQVTTFMVGELAVAAAWIHQSGTNSGNKAVAAATIQAAQIAAAAPLPTPAKAA